MALLPGTCLAIAPGMWVVKMLVAAEEVERRTNQSACASVSQTATGHSPAVPTEFPTSVINKTMAVTVATPSMVEEAGVSHFCSNRILLQTSRANNIYSLTWGTWDWAATWIQVAANPPPIPCKTWLMTNSAADPRAPRECNIMPTPARRISSPVNMIH